MTFYALVVRNIHQKYIFSEKLKSICNNAIECPLPISRLTRVNGVENLFVDGFEKFPLADVKK